MQINTSPYPGFANPDEPAQRLRRFLTDVRIPSNMGGAEWHQFKAELKRRNLSKPYQDLFARGRPETIPTLMGIQNQYLRDEVDYLRHWAFKGGYPATRKALDATNLLERERWRRQAELDQETYKEVMRAYMLAEARKIGGNPRDQAPKELLPPDWFEPMPIFCRLPRAGYAQATGINRKRIEALLNREGCRPVDRLRIPRGRPLALYGFETTLVVIQEWIGVWLRRSPDLRARRLLRLVIQLEECSDVAKADAMRSVLLPHATRIAKDSPSEEDRDLFTDILVPALESRAGWQAFREEAARRHQEHEAELAAQKALRPWEEILG